MTDKEVFQAMRDVVDALEEQFAGDLEGEDSEQTSLYSQLYVCLNSLSGLLQQMKDSKNSKDEQTVVTAQSIEEMAALASAFDKSGDALLMKQAAVLDEILLTIGASKRQVADAKSAQDREVERLKALAKEDEKDPYTMVKAEHDKQLKVEDARKQIADKVKEYRPMEESLMTRTCPDHPGAQMARIAEHTYQCSLDKAVYNYQSGFTTMKGNKVPGSSVTNQTQNHDRPNEFTSFDSRESRLNK